MRETSCHFDHGVKHQVDHQGNAAAVTIGHQSKDERAHGTERQRQSNRESDVSVRPVKLFRDRRQREDDQEKVEGVKRPAKKTGENGGTMAVFSWRYGRRYGNWRYGRVRGNGQVLSSCAGKYYTTNSPTVKAAVSRERSA